MCGVQEVLLHKYREEDGVIIIDFSDDDSSDECVVVEVMLPSAATKSQTTPRTSLPKNMAPRYQSETHTNPEKHPDQNDITPTQAHTNNGNTKRKYSPFSYSSNLGKEGASKNAATTKVISNDVIKTPTSILGPSLSPHDYHHDDNDDDDQDECSPPRLKHLHPHLSNTLWRALNSAEPQNGATLLTELVTVHHTYPTTSFSKNLSKFILRGPVSECHAYTDPHKIELACRLAALSPPPCDVVSWEDVEHCLKIEVEGHGMSLTSVARGLEYCLSVFSGEGKGVTGILGGCVGGIREAVEFTARCNARAWVRFGALVFDEGSGERGTSAMDCLTALGGISCRVAKMYCGERGVDVNRCGECARIFGQSLLLELESTNLDQVSVELIEKIKMYFALSLEDDTCLGFQDNVEKFLNVCT